MFQGQSRCSAATRPLITRAAGATIEDRAQISTPVCLGIVTFFTFSHLKFLEEEPAVK